MSLEIPPERIVVHTDLDGVACAVLLKRIFNVDNIVFVEPSEIQRGLFMAEPTDIVADLPFPKEGCALWFDHHAQPEPPKSPHYNLDTTQLSCGGYIYRKYKNEHDLSFFKPLIERVDIIDSGKYSPEDIMEPDAAEQISISLIHQDADDKFRLELIDMLSHLPVGEVAKHPTVQRHVQEDKQLQEQFFKEAELKIDGDLVIADFRGKKRVRGANAFRVYLEYPECQFFVYIRDDEDNPNIVRIAAYENTWRPTCKPHIGKILAKYGGGGHKGAGGTTLKREGHEKIVRDILEELKER